jgi:hypothetical protein
LWAEPEDFQNYMKYLYHTDPDLSKIDILPKANILKGLLRGNVEVQGFDQDSDVSECDGNGWRSSRRPRRVMAHLTKFS